MRSWSVVTATSNPSSLTATPPPWSPVGIASQATEAVDRQEIAGLRYDRLLDGHLLVDALVPAARPGKDTISGHFSRLAGAQNGRGCRLG
jgi:hypothetical protein